jgi:hypothetical protein
MTSPAQLSKEEHRVLHHNDLQNGSKLDNFLHMVSQKPLRERLKLLNSKNISNAYPRFLYKYRPLVLNNIEHVKQLRDYLVESRLWLSSPAAFNDPFDMRGRHIFNGTPQAKRKLIILKLKKYRSDLTKGQREIEASHLLANGALPESLDRIQSQHRNMSGVCSFAGDARNILMWSHYGSNHTGICLQFRLAQDIPIFSQAVHMEYSSEYPVVDYLDEDYQKSIIPTLFRKATNWEYEQERRIIQPYGANCYLAFNPSALTALVLGCELNEISEAIIADLLIERLHKGFPPVKVFRACRHDTQYKLRLHCRNNLGG